MLIELNDVDFKFAVKIGQKRQEEALAKNLPDKYGFDGIAGLAVHIEGAAGEMAVAQALNIPWDATINTFKSLPDLGANIEIRTRSKSEYDLLVRPDDQDDKIFILVTRKGAQKFDVIGWIKAKDAKQNQWLKTYGNRPGAFFVPKEYLKKIEELYESSRNTVQKSS